MRSLDVRLIVVVPSGRESRRGSHHDAAVGAAVGILAASLPPVRAWLIALRYTGLWLLAILLSVVVAMAPMKVFGVDSHAFWLAWHHTPMYGASPNTVDAYLYSPAFAQLIWPLAQLPWPVFFSIWTGVGFLIYAWLLWPVRPSYRIPLLLLCLPQVMIGNIWPIFALVAVAGFRRPGMWAFPLLTKVTAATGFLWFAGRREWRAFGVAALTAAVVTGLSVAVSPHLWAGWIHLLFYGGDGGTPYKSPNIPFVPRLAVAVALALYASMRNRPRLFVVTIGLASPVFAANLLLSNLAVLAALPRLERMRRR